MPLDALIFDIDGTMADTEEGHRTAFNLTFERMRLGWTWDRDEYRRLLNVTGGKERLAHYIAHLPLGAPARERLAAHIPAIHAEKTKFYSSMAADGGIPLRPGVARLLAEAGEAGLRIGIASTTTRANIDALMRATLGPNALARFDVIACGDQPARKKPAPDIYRLVLDGLRLAPGRAIAFEDSANGLAAAHAAGLWTVVTPTFWTEGSDFGAAAIVLPHLGDPSLPLPGEPGGKLRDAAWLTLAELRRLRG